MIFRRALAAVVQPNAAVIRLSHETGTWDYHREREQSHRYPEWRLSIRCVDQRYDQGENREGTARRRHDDLLFPDGILG